MAYENNIKFIIGELDLKAREPTESLCTYQNQSPSTDGGWKLSVPNMQPTLRTATSWINRNTSNIYKILTILWLLSHIIYYL